LSGGQDECDYLEEHDAEEKNEEIKNSMMICEWRIRKQEVVACPKICAKNFRHHNRPAD
jgi:hypothetical protein